MEEAGKACPAGYAILDGQQEHGRVSIPNGQRVDQYATAARFLMIRCR